MHMLMQLNKPADLCPFILSNFVKSKKENTLRSVGKQKKSELIQSILHSCSKTVLENKSQGRQAHILLCYLTQIYINPTWTEMSRVQSGIYSITCITEN